MSSPASTPGSSPATTCAGTACATAGASGASEQGWSARRSARSATPPARATSATSHRIAATARDTGNGTCVVRVEADRRRDRTVRVASGVAVGGAAAAGVVGVALVHGPASCCSPRPSPSPPAAGSRRPGAARAKRVVREVDRVIDAVDQQVEPARLRVDVVPPRQGRAREPGVRRRRTSAWSSAVGADRGVVLVRRHALAVGERAARLLDEEAHGGDVVGRHADGVDGDVERALGDEGVLPEVAEAAGSPGVTGEADERRRQAEAVPAAAERDADLGVGDRVDRRHAARPAAGERPAACASPTTAGRAPAPTRRRRRRRRRGRGRSASPTPGCRGRSPDVPSIGSTIHCHGDAGSPAEPVLLAEQAVVRPVRAPAGRRSPPRRPGRVR